MIGMQSIPTDPAARAAFFLANRLRSAAAAGHVARVVRLSLPHSAPRLCVFTAPADSIGEAVGHTFFADDLADPALAAHVAAVVRAGLRVVFDSDVVDAGAAAAVYERAKAADAAWDSALPCVVNARYLPVGRGAPRSDLAKLHDAASDARECWSAVFRARCGFDSMFGVA